MRRYSAESARISSGVPIRRIIGVALAKPSTVSSAPSPTLSTSAVCTCRSTASGSCAPQLWAMTTPAPLHRPTNSPTSKLTKAPVAPTAASAFVPTKLPTISVSAVLYSCWNSVPNQIGKKKSSSCLGMLPVRISVCFRLLIAHSLSHTSPILCYFPAQCNPAPPGHGFV